MILSFFLLKYVRNTPVRLTWIIDELQKYRISSNKHRASNKRHPLIKPHSLDIHIEISTSSHDKHDK